MGTNRLAAHELLGRDAAGDVNVVTTGRRSDNGEQQRREEGKMDLLGLLGTCDCHPREGERCHELEEPLAEQLALREGECVANDAGAQAYEDVGRVRQRRRGLIHEDVPFTPPPIPQSRAMIKTPTTVKFR